MTSSLVYDRKAVLMQRTADFVRAGYRYWTSGEVRPERVLALTRKFARLYGIHQSRHQRAYAKAKGEGCAVLLLYAPHTALKRRHTARSDMHAAHETLQTAQLTMDTARAEPDAAMLRWILLVAPGDHPAHQLEQLKDAGTAAGRVVLTGYELVQLPRPGQEKPAWTWRMDDNTYQGWRLRLIAAARKRATLLSSETAQLARTPGFAGCRAQVKKLLKLAAGEWRRRHPSEPALSVPRQPYLQRLPNGGSSLTAWLSTYTKQTSCAANTGMDACHTDS